MPRLSTFVQAAVLSLALPFASVNGVKHEKNHARRHHDLALQARGQTFDNARFTFYDVGLGACGIVNKPSDFIVALNSEQFDESSGYPAKNCFKMITIEANGKSAQAQVTDECPGCPFGGLDFSRGLFDHFASEDVGVLTGSWYFNDGGPAAPPAPKPTPPPPPPPPPPSPPPKTTPKPKPTPTPTPPPPPPPPEPTTTWSPPPEPTTTSEKPKPPPSSSSEEHLESSSSVEHSSSSVASSSSVHSSSSAAPSSASASASSAAASATPSVNAVDQVNQAVLGLAALAVAGAGGAQ